MGWIWVLAAFLLAMALAMDAFAVSLSLGAGINQSFVTNHFSCRLTDQAHTQHAKLSNLARWSGIYFGVAQGIMPLFGYLLGLAILKPFTQYATLIGGIILCGLGLKMGHAAIYNKDITPEHSHFELPSHRLFLLMAIVTSIDAMAVGFTLTTPLFLAVLTCLIIAMVTGVLSVVGTYVGYHFGKKFERHAEMFGAIILLGIGIKSFFNL